ncbi:MAG: signal peptidase II [Planctomycetota bacterium]|nr:MAG: signal peptidase II [Planctomycetota bacterium]
MPDVAPNPASCPSVPEVALRCPAAHLRFWTAAAFFLVLDLGSKSWIFSHLKPEEVRPVIPHVLEFRRSLNDGAVFGSFTGQTGLFITASVLALLFVLYVFSTSRRSQRVLHVALGMVLAGALGNLYDRCFVKADVVVVTDSDGRSRSIIGTLRGDPDGPVVRIGQWPDGTRARAFRREEVREIRHQGVVRDFLNFVPTFPKWVPRLGGSDIWPWIFNVADASLVCGVLLLFIGHWFERPPPQEDS